MNAIATTTTPAAKLAQFMIEGDLSKLSEEQRAAYYLHVCESLGLNPATRPLEYIRLNNKLVLYARKDCTEQLRKRDHVSTKIAAREVVEGVYVVTATARTPDGREDESIGAVPIEGVKGEARANAMMKAETKAKRRVTLSICGLGMLDESEVESIPGAQPHLPQVIARRSESVPILDEPGDAHEGDAREPLTTETRERIEAALAALNRKWDEATIKWCEKVIDRPIGVGARISALSELEGWDVLNQLNLKLSKQHATANGTA